MEIVTVKSTAKAGVPVNAGYTDRTLQEEKHMQPARILDSYQRELEIRKLKSLFPLMDSICFLSKQAACSSRACRSPLLNSLKFYMRYKHKQGKKNYSPA